MQQPTDERFDELYRRHADAVAAYVRRRAPADAVDDVVAETFLVCWRRLDDVPENALPWLYAVARKTLANELRKLARRAHAPVSATYEPPVAGDPLLATAFRALSDGDREVLRLVAWEGLAVADAAAALGCTPLACRVRFHRAKRRLARRLAEAESGRVAARPRPKTEGATR
jgi:RNA polymerase sigma-70 factor (ECF subfamily)